MLTRCKKNFSWANSEENDCNRRRICGISKELLQLNVTDGGSSSSVWKAGGQSLSGSE